MTSAQARMICAVVAGSVSASAYAVWPAAGWAFRVLGRAGVAEETAIARGAIAQGGRGAVVGRGTRGADYSWLRKQVREQVVDEVISRAIDGLLNTGVPREVANSQVNDAIGAARQSVDYAQDAQRISDRMVADAQRNSDRIVADAQQASQRMQAQIQDVYRGSVQSNCLATYFDGRLNRLINSCDHAVEIREGYIQILNPNATTEALRSAVYEATGEWMPHQPGDGGPSIVSWTCASSCVVPPFGVMDVRPVIIPMNSVRLPDGRVIQLRRAGVELLGPMVGVIQRVL